MTTAWENLVRLYADGQVICNCGQAYYSPCGEGWDGTEKRYRDDMLACKSGCSANQISCKEYIASRVIKELRGS